MKKKELEKIGKRLLPELPGFTAKGELLFIEPIGHSLRAILFAGSIDPRGFYAHLVVQPLFIPTEHIGLNFGWRLGRERLWNGDSLDLIAELGATIKCEALPFLSRIKSPRDVAQAAISLHKSADAYVQRAVAYSYARAGDVDKALRELDKLVHLLRLREQYPHAREGAERAEMLKRTLLADPAEAQRLLEVWEKETAKNLGLET